MRKCSKTTWNPAAETHTLQWSCLDGLVRFKYSLWRKTSGANQNQKPEPWPWKSTVRAQTIRSADSKHKYVGAGFRLVTRKWVGEQPRHHQQSQHRQKTCCSSCPHSALRELGNATQVMGYSLPQGPGEHTSSIWTHPLSIIRQGRVLWVQTSGSYSSHCGSTFLFGKGVVVGQVRLRGWKCFSDDLGS